VVTAPILWYFADPMCSWCWGFSPVIEQVRELYRPRLKISLVLGGLRPNTTAPLTPDERAQILHHWQQVHERTGQGFQFENAMPPGFIYNTEPACRAIACMADISPSLIFPMLNRLQRAFYMLGNDITRTDVLTELAVELGVRAEDFLVSFVTGAARHRTQKHFNMTRESGIMGFPSLLLQSGNNVLPVAYGWQPLEQVKAAIDALLAG
jgi:putative protein-disulfide isomerase